MYGISSAIPAQTPKSTAYLPSFGNARVGRGSDAEPTAHADDQRDEELPLHVAPECVLHALDQRLGSRWRREAPVDHGRKSLHVEQHVDRHDDDEYDVEEQRRRPQVLRLRPVEGLRRVFLDVLVAIESRNFCPWFSTFTPFRWCESSQVWKWARSRVAPVAGGRPDSTVK